MSLNPGLNLKRLRYSRYLPTPLEFGITLGVVALGFLIFFLGLKLLPLKPAESDQ